MTLDKQIEALCRDKRLTFHPWEIPPWDVPDEGPSPYRPGCAGHECWEPAQALRRQLIAELSAGSRRKGAR